MTAAVAAAPGVAGDIEAVLAQLDAELVALEPVKTRIREIAALLVDRPPAPRGRPGDRRVPRCTCASPATPARARRPSRCGWPRSCTGWATSRSPRSCPSRATTSSASTSATPRPKTREVLKRARGGVLFIDEAYYLYRPENERDYGQEAIEILLQVMEAERDELVVVLAGYRDRMETFFRSNPGMGSRVAHHVHFPDFDVDELIAIARPHARPAAPTSSRPTAREALRAPTSSAACARPRFANARSIRNAIDRARLRQASRLYDRRERARRASDL